MVQYEDATVKWCQTGRVGRIGEKNATREFSIHSDQQPFDQSCHDSFEAVRDEPFSGLGSTWWLHSRHHTIADLGGSCSRIRDYVAQHPDFFLIIFF
jgi:hypothetical protein